MKMFISLLVIISVIENVTPAAKIDMHTFYKDKVTYQCKPQQLKSCHPRPCLGTSRYSVLNFRCKCGLAERPLVIKNFGARGTFGMKCIPYKKEMKKKSINCPNPKTKFIKKKKKNTCKCRDEYEPTDGCKILKNGCTHKVANATFSGNEACAIHQGNICHPEPGTYNYMCTCKTPNKRTRILEQDNCRGHSERFCQINLCLGFSFENVEEPPDHKPNSRKKPKDVFNITGKYGATCYDSQKKCKCPLGYSGQRCEVLNTDPYHFSSDSYCYPSCIDGKWALEHNVIKKSGQQVRIGVCHLQNEYGCLGLVKEWKACSVYSFCLEGDIYKNPTTRNLIQDYNRYNFEDNGMDFAKITLSEILRIISSFVVLNFAIYLSHHFVNKFRVRRRKILI